MESAVYDAFHTATFLFVLFCFGPNRETKAELGRSWKYPTIPQAGCYLQSSVAKFMQISEGDYVIMAFNWTESFPTFSDQAQSQSHYDLTHGDSNVFITMKVTGIFDGSQGKWPQDYKNGKPLCALTKPQPFLIPVCLFSLSLSLSLSLFLSLSSGRPGILNYSKVNL